MPSRYTTTTTAPRHSSLAGAAAATGTATADRQVQPVGRIASLDGLRGVAAIVVLLYHLTLVARPYLETGRTGDAWWWLTETPLKLVTAGTEAVLVFFVLSGLVVALPAFSRGFCWVQMLTGRMVRLYLPVWASLALSVLLLQAIPRSGDAVQGNWMLNGNAEEPSVSLLATEASLVPSSYDLNNVLWSLRWEIIFSLSLPILVALAVLVRAKWQVAAIAAIGLSVAGRSADIDALVYLPVFFLGSLAASRFADLDAWALRRSPAQWAWVLATSAGLLIASWLTRGIAPSGSVANTVLWGLSAAGAAGVVVAAIGSPLLGRVLSARVPGWLGKISFSLYLVHVPIIAAVTWLLGDAWWWAVALIAVPLSVLVGWLFFEFVERPSHRLARAVGSRAGALVDRRGERR